MTIHDGEIIRRSLEQPSAFAELYDRHERVIFRYAARRVGASLADDIASETFLVAFTRRRDFTGSEDARAWLLGIATTLMRQHARTEAKAWRGMLASDLARTDIDQIDAADARLDAKRLTRRLGKALARLPTGDRDALLLHTFGDLDYEGISEALSIPIGTVRSRLNRVRRKLRAVAEPTLNQEKEESHGRNLAPAPSAD
ncbi:RNA polymerase sigma-70 factor (ECF subfamily) [Microbacterium resistens]|uniref:RNA polymerase sigma-70 factor (ECF subfamily) n=1 Tax=Microbacterium resistens TaxID=156977 RepID=A0ABU1SI54_9MICO|nr:sigma-70 family RNA polymerase sigma factor [Microbacterium resistens]MDR6868998.1 RNA polymerase sigma-70 factor (ECF subfamily) [Microbacterium resistens]